MTELLTGVEAPSDAELISSVRGGDLSAYGELFARHVDAARRLGRQLVRGPDVDDLVSDAFAKTLNVLQNGGGPDVAFRAYLLTSLRRLHVDKIRAAKKVQPEEDMTVFDDGVPFQDPAIASFDNGAAAKAFASLPERWQLVLWHLEVEGQKPADIAPLLGMTPNSVSALAYRAREGLRQAFLTMHLADTPTEQCRWVNEHLGAYVRKGLSKRDTTKVEDHLEECRRCTAMYLELNEVNSNLAGIIAPLLLGAAAAGYISSAGGAGVTGVSALFGRFRDAVSGNGTTGGAGAGGSTTAAGGGAAVTTGGLITAGGVVAASVAAITAAAFIFGGGAEKEVIIEADQPIGVVQTPAPGGAEDREPRERSAAEDSESAESLESAEADEPLAEDVPFAAADDGFDLDGTADSPDDFPAAPAGDFDVVAPPVVAPADPAPGGDSPAAPQDDTPPASGDGDPATEDPGTDPGTEEPGTDDPGTDPDAPPIPTPAPTEPADGQEDPAAGGDTTDGTDSTAGDDQQSGGGSTGDNGSGSNDGDTVVKTALTLTVVDAQVDSTAEAGPHYLAFDFDMTADGDLPERLTLTLESEPLGISFGSDEYCTAAGEGATVACAPTLNSLGGGVAAMVVSSAGSSYHMSAPLNVPADQPDTTLTFSITAPEGYELEDTLEGLTANYTAPVDEGDDDDGDDGDPTDPGDDGDDSGDLEAPIVTAALDSTDPGKPARILTVTVTNAPKGTVRFELVAPEGGSLSASLGLTAPEDCSRDDDAAVSCEVPDNGAGVWELGINVPPGHLDVLVRATFADPDADLIDVPLVLED